MKLANYPGVEFRDADQAVVEFSREIRRFRQDIRRGTSYHLKAHTAKLDLLSITSCYCPSPRDIYIEADARHFVLMRCFGPTEYRVAGRLLEPSPGGGLIFDPHYEGHLRLDGIEQAIAIRIPVDQIVAHVTAMIGAPPPGCLYLFGVLPPHSAVWRMLNSIIHELERKDGLFSSPSASLVARRWQQSSLIAAAIEKLLTYTYIPAEREHNNAHCHRLHYNKAMEYMAANPTEPITVVRLALVVGIKVRTLEQAFHAFGKAPMTAFREIRLQRVHDELLHPADDDVTVRAVQLKYGFHNGGDFAKYYKAMFGESPCDTWKKGRKGTS